MRRGSVVLFKKWLLEAVAVAAVFLLARQAFATDGLKEINHARALAGGVTPGDAPGYPVSIREPGSYILTGSLAPDLPDFNGNLVVILVEAVDVTLDLRGHTIGRTTLGSIPPDFGVFIATMAAAGGAVANVRLMNGNIVRQNVAGIRSESPGSVTIESIAMRQCATGIILTGMVSSRVARCQVTQAQGVGIYAAGPGSTIEENAVSNAGGTGIIAAGSVSRVIGNTVSQSGGQRDPTAVIGGGSVEPGAGIEVAPGSLVSENTVTLNGSLSTSPSDPSPFTVGAGILAPAGALISGNSCYLNLGDGIKTGPAALVSSNVCQGNQRAGIFCLDGFSPFPYQNGVSIIGNTVTGNFIGVRLALVESTPGSGTFLTTIRLTDNVIYGNGDVNTPEVQNNIVPAPPGPPAPDQGGTGNLF